MLGLRFGFSPVGILIFLCFTLIACTPPAKNGSEADETPSIQVTPLSGQFVINIDVANLRSGPGIEFESMGTLNKGEIVMIDGISADGDWYRMTSGAWVAAGFVMPYVAEPSPTDTPMETLVSPETPTSTPTSTPTLSLADTPAPTPTTTISPTPMPEGTSIPSATSPPTESTCSGPPAGWVTYIVQAGDNLFRLGIRTGCSVTELQQVNCLPDTTIYTGQQLFVPRLPATATLFQPHTPTPTRTVIPPGGDDSTPTQTPTPTLLPPHTPTPTATPIPYPPPPTATPSPTRTATPAP